MAVGALSACGDSPTEVKGSEVSQAVQTQVLTPAGMVATVTCPPKTKAKKNIQIRCSIADSDSNKGSATVTVLDAKGKLGTAKGDVVDIQRAVVMKNATDNASAKGVSGLKCGGDSVTPKQGALYFCTGVVRGSGAAAVLVKQKDDKGAVSVTVRTHKIRTLKIKRQIAKLYRKKAKIHVKVTCPAKVKSRVGSHFTCKVTNPANGKSQQIIATQKNTKNTFNLRIK